MKRKIKALKRRSSNRLSNITTVIILVLALVGILIGGTIGFIISPVEHLTETEINECTKIFNEIFEDGKIKPINDEIKSIANKNEYDINIDYIESIITFSFENELKENLVFNISTEGKISKEIDSTIAENNRISYIVFGIIAGCMIVLILPVSIYGIIIFYEKIISFIRKVKKNKKKRKYSIVKYQNTPDE